MRGVKCSWVEMLRRRQQIEAAECGEDVAELRCVGKPAVSEWSRACEVISAIENQIQLTEFEHFQPTHAVEIARHFRKLRGKAEKWDEDTKDEIVEWVEKCEEEAWTVQRVKDELAASIRTEIPTSNLVDVATCPVSLEQTGQKFACVYADPPWAYGNQGTRGSTDNHYHTLTVDEMCDPEKWPIAKMVADQAHLHLWTTNAFLFESQRLIEAWGFEYKSCFVWVKPQLGMGNYWRVSHEFLLLGVRGNLAFQDRSLISWLESPRTKHSAKPQAIRALIEKASPGPRLELFGREQVTGWTVLGNQVSPQGVLL